MDNNCMFGKLVWDIKVHAEFKNDGRISLMIGKKLHDLLLNYSQQNKIEILLGLMIDL